MVVSHALRYITGTGKCVSESAGRTLITISGCSHFRKGSSSDNVDGEKARKTGVSKT